MNEVSNKQISFAKSKGYRYAGKGFFIYQGLVLINGNILSVKSVTIEALSISNCRSTCSQSDFYKNGKCDINGCFSKDEDSSIVALPPVKYNGSFGDTIPQ